MNRKSPKEPGTVFRITYQIIVKGKLSDDWADWFNGSLVSIEHMKEGAPVTILTCQVRDQAELLGILNRLNNLNLQLLHLTTINNEGEKHV